MKEGINYLRLAAIYTQRFDWLFSGDDGEDNFLEKLEEELLDFKNREDTSKPEELFSKLAIDFAKYISPYDFDTKTELWSYWDCPQGEYTTEELFESFKKHFKL